MLMKCVMQERGEILYGEYTNSDNGKGTSDDIDPNYPGCEGWSAAGVLTAADGTVISTDYTMPANFLVYWDGDLGREIQDNIYISKWNGERERTETIFTATGTVSINGTRANPALTADIFGDWREEIIYPTKDDSILRIYTTTNPTSYKVPTLMHDIQYRMHVAYQNDCYNQPTHLSYYLGFDTENIPVPQMYNVVTGEKNPDLTEKCWNIENLYSNEPIESQEYDIQVAFKYDSTGDVLNYTITNNTEQDIDGYGVIAIYDRNGVLQHIETQSNISKETVTKTVDWHDYDGCTAKAYIWESTKSIKPYDSFYCQDLII